MSPRPARSAIDELADAAIAEIARTGRDHVLRSEFPSAPRNSCTISIAPARPVRSYEDIVRAHAAVNFLLASRDK